MICCAVQAAVGCSVTLKCAAVSDKEAGFVLLSGERHKTRKLKQALADAKSEIDELQEAR